MLRVMLAGLLLLIAAPLARAAVEPVPTGKLPTDAVPLSYALHFKADPRQDRFEGHTTIQVRLKAPAERVWLHAQELDIGKLQVSGADGKPIMASTHLHPQAGVLEVRFDKAIAAQTIALDFQYSAPFNAKLQGLYKVKVGDDAYAMTQMEPISARFAFPGFDEPRFKVPFDISLTVPVQDVAVANTLQTSEVKSADGKWKTLTFATTKPLPTYLVALAIGPWDVVEGKPIPANAVRKQALPLRGLGPRGSKQRLGWALETAAAIVPFFEDYTRQAYPFDKLDLLGAPDFSAGAMENAGLIIYRDAALLADGKSAAGQFRGVFNINAHEIAHQWYGDLVTVPWWNDIWLNEAYATWGQAKVAMALHPEYQADLGALEGRLYAMGSDSLLSTRKVRQPIENHGDIQTAFDGITYQKGASVLTMFENWVGEATFRKGMREYLASHVFGSGSSDDLIASLTKASGKGEAFAKGMRSFLDQPGAPLIKVQLQCKAGRPNLELAQTRYLPYGVMSKDVQQWTVPVCLRLGHGERSDTQCVLLDQPQQHFALDGACPDWVMPNADARGYYRFELDGEGFAQLAKVSAKLNPAEQLMYADALSSAFSRGTLPPTRLLEAMPALASSELPQVATALLGRYNWITEYLVDEPTRAVLNDWAASLYAPQMNKLGWRRVEGESGTTTALRSRLSNFLAFDARDPAARAALNQQGRAALGLDGSGTVDLARADADLLGNALRVAVEEGGASAFDATQKAFEASRDTRQRYALLEALGSTRDPVLAARARDYGLSKAVQLGEMAMLYGAQMSEPKNRAATWQWMTEHYDAFRARLTPFSAGRMPGMFSGGRCSDAEADALSAYFAPRIKDLVGGERGLRQSLERIRQCGALRGHVNARPLKEWAVSHKAG
ncbi:M1 family metallopeptidase [Dokdonella sp.]|uniref:M1 family metallopeptidase n=1 Tax=Dokdonella sp. TaxID=2291710 RepID=UPI0025BCF998|nr:M1 family metallopeptidase [Dokdonella sp.]MBX3690030.1 M1 family metallopeptidase [Dokdonella sp.]